MEYVLIALAMFVAAVAFPILWGLAFERLWRVSPSIRARIAKWRGSRR
jgi:hypothetical protein